MEGGALETEWYSRIGTSGTAGESSPAVVPRRGPGSLRQMGGTVDPEIEALCQMASRTASSRGHEIDGWDRSSGAEGVTATATCRRCGRTAHVRAEGTLKGAAGRALAEPCDKGKSP
jgi:hypothetical protein